MTFGTLLPVGTVSVGRGSLAVDVLGDPDAPPLLLVAGGGADRRSWSRLLPELCLDVLDLERCRPIARSLASDHRVAVFDQAGVGDSLDVPPAMSALDYAADALTVGRETLGPNFSVLGVSLGGIAAQHLALEWPDAVDALVLACTVAGLSTFVPPGPTDEIPQDERSFSKRFLHAERRLYRHFMERSAAVPRAESAQESQISVFLSHEPGDRLRSIGVRTTVICGLEDNTFPVENSRMLASLIPHASLIEIPQAGHALQFEVPDVLAEVLRPSDQ